MGKLPVPTPRGYPQGGFQSQVTDPAQFLLISNTQVDDGKPVLRMFLLVHSPFWATRYTYPDKHNTLIHEVSRQACRGKPFRLFSRPQVVPDIDGKFQHITDTIHLLQVEITGALWAF